MITSNSTPPSGARDVHVASDLSPQQLDINIKDLMIQADINMMLNQDELPDENPASKITGVPSIQDVNMLDEDKECNTSEINTAPDLLNGKNKSITPVIKQSFREAVQTSSQWFSEAQKIVISSTEWEDNDIPFPDPMKVVSFHKDTLEKLRKPWKLTLMGKCLGISVRPSFITQRVRVMWRPKGYLEIIDLGKDVYLFRFSIQDDYERAMLGGPWFILDHYLMITKWKPNFRPSMNPFDRMTVWIRFPELPVEYYDKEALFDIAKLACNPLRVDYATDHLTRARYARCFCFLCGKIGHTKEKCTLKVGLVDKEIPKNGEEQGKNSTHPTTATDGEDIQEAVLCAAAEPSHSIDQPIIISTPNSPPPPNHSCSTPFHENAITPLPPPNSISLIPHPEPIPVQADTITGRNFENCFNSSISPDSQPFDSSAMVIDRVASNSGEDRDDVHTLLQITKMMNSQLHHLNPLSVNLPSPSTPPSQQPLIPWFKQQVPWPSYPQHDLIPPPSNPQIINITLGNSEQDLESPDHLMKIFVIRKGIVGLQLEVNFWETKNTTRELDSMVIPLKMHDIVSMERTMQWKEWDKFDILFCGETKSNGLRAEKVAKLLGFDAFQFINPNGLRGRIWLMYNRNVELIDYVEGETKNYFHALFKFSPDSREVLLSAVHAPSSPAKRHKHWNDLQATLPPDDTPWLFLGDLNEVTKPSEKSGGLRFRQTQCLDLNKLAEAACLVDLGFSGNPLTWHNAREGLDLIQKRLDRALGNPSWLNTYPNTQGTIPNAINDSYISLIPKFDCPMTMKDFRPIGLCNSIYKLITKCISNRLKPIMDDLISPFQSSFIPNRSIEENIIIIKEVAHHFNKVSSKANLMALKIDLSKAFDCLEWSFIKDTLLSINLPSNIVNLIISCICNPRISLLWNGEVTESFSPSRGIRQGDPLSPYIFVLCLDRLSCMIQYKCGQCWWRGVIRNDKGIWVAGFATRFNALTAASAELMAIRDGLLLAWDKKIKDLELETDADSLSKMLKDPKSFEDSDLGNIIRDVAALLGRNWNVTIFHANRCVNYVADRLALMGRTKYKIGEKVPFNYPPPEVFQTYAMEIPEGQNP
uniref:CCHC-type domain-containing protein n=1 Tax=Chenopodium quinoa TaxID=63459 RepID=A0A803LHK0_CHEQI